LDYPLVNGASTRWFEKTGRVSLLGLRETERRGLGENK